MGSPGSTPAVVRVGGNKSGGVTPLVLAVALSIVVLWGVALAGLL